MEYRIFPFPLCLPFYPISYSSQRLRRLKLRKLSHSCQWNGKGGTLSSQLEKLKRSGGDSTDSLLLSCMCRKQIHKMANYSISHPLSLWVDHYLDKLTQHSEGFKYTLIWNHHPSHKVRLSLEWEQHWLPAKAIERTKFSDLQDVSINITIFKVSRSGKYVSSCYNPSTLDAETEGWLISRPARAS